MIEGAWYCPSIPKTLINATVDYRDGRIDEATWKARIEARRAFRLRVKDRLPDGQLKEQCPADGISPTAICDLKPESDVPKNKGKTPIPVIDALRANKPRICDQTSVNFPPDAGTGQAAKLMQTLHFGSPEWADTFYRLRNTIEGINGTAKDGAHAALDDPERRRVRGVVAQSFFAALLLFATNIRKIRTFLAHVRIDADGVPRRPRKLRSTTKPLASWTPATVALAGAPPP